MIISTLNNILNPCIRYFSLYNLILCVSYYYLGVISHKIPIKKVTFPSPSFSFPLPRVIVWVTSFIILQGMNHGMDQANLLVTSYKRNKSRPHITKQNKTSTPHSTNHMHAWQRISNLQFAFHISSNTFLNYSLRWWTIRKCCCLFNILVELSKNIPESNTNISVLHTKKEQRLWK